MKKQKPPPPSRSYRMVLLGISASHSKKGPSHSMKDQSQTVDALEEHIKIHRLPLVKSVETPSDGNCWYNAISDQIRLLEIPNKPANTDSLRKAICDVLPSLNQAKDWISLLGGLSEFKKFLTHHKKNRTWTDDMGVMCQATALYLGRNIHIVGTKNTGTREGFTKLEGGGRADMLPPLYVGYYQEI